MSIEFKAETIPVEEKRILGSYVIIELQQRIEESKRSIEADIEQLELRQVEREQYTNAVLRPALKQHLRDRHLHQDLRKVLRNSEIVNLLNGLTQLLTLLEPFAELRTKIARLKVDIELMRCLQPEEVDKHDAHVITSRLSSRLFAQEPLKEQEQILRNITCLLEEEHGLDGLVRVALVDFIERQADRFGYSVHYPFWQHDGFEDHVAASRTSMQDLIAISARLLKRISKREVLILKLKLNRAICVALICSNQCAELLSFHAAVQSHEIFLRGLVDVLNPSPGLVDEALSQTKLEQRQFYWSTQQAALERFETFAKNGLLIAESENAAKLLKQALEVEKLLEEVSLGCE